MLLRGTFCRNLRLNVTIYCRDGEGREIGTGRGGKGREIGTGRAGRCTVREQEG